MNRVEILLEVNAADGGVEFQRMVARVVEGTATINRAGQTTANAFGPGVRGAEALTRAIVAAQNQGNTLARSFATLSKNPFAPISQDAARAGRGVEQLQAKLQALYLGVRGGKITPPDAERELARLLTRLEDVRQAQIRLVGEGAARVPLQNSITTAQQESDRREREARAQRAREEAEAGRARRETERIGRFAPTSDTVQRDARSAQERLTALNNTAARMARSTEGSLSGEFDLAQRKADALLTVMSKIYSDAAGGKVPLSDLIINLDRSEKEADQLIQKMFQLKQAAVEAGRQPAGIDRRGAIDAADSLQARDLRLQNQFAGLRNRGATQQIRDDARAAGEEAARLQRYITRIFQILQTAPPGSIPALERQLERAGGRVDQLTQKFRQLQSAQAQASGGANDVGRQVGGLRDIIAGNFLAEFFYRATMRAKEFLAESIRAGVEATRIERRLIGASFGSGRSFERNQAAAESLRGDTGFSRNLANEVQAASQLFATYSQKLNDVDAFARNVTELAVARGRPLEEVPRIISQLIAGVDEATDRLFGVNPSVIQARYAESIGKTIDRLTDVEKKQALFNAVMEKGAENAGGLNAYMQTAAGRLERAQNRVDDISASFGRLILSNRTVNEFLEKMLDLLEKISAPRPKISLGFDVPKTGAAPGTPDAYAQINDPNTNALAEAYAKQYADSFSAKFSRAFDKFIGIAGAPGTLVREQDYSFSPGKQLGIQKATYEETVRRFSNAYDEDIERGRTEYYNERLAALQRAQAEGRYAYKETATGKIFRAKNIQAEVVAGKRAAGSYEFLGALTDEQFQVEVEKQMAADTAKTEQIKRENEEKKKREQEEKAAADKFRSQQEQATQKLTNLENRAYQRVVEDAQIIARDNPFVKILVDQQTALDRVKKEWGIYGDKVVAEQLRIEQSALNTDLFEKRVTNSLAILDKQFEAFQLRQSRSLFELNGQEERRLSIIERQLEAASRIPELLDKANRIQRGELSAEGSKEAAALAGLGVTDAQDRAFRAQRERALADQRRSLNISRRQQEELQQAAQGADANSPLRRLYIAQSRGEQIARQEEETRARRELNRITGIFSQQFEAFQRLSRSVGEGGGAYGSRARGAIDAATIGAYENLPDRLKDQIARGARPDVRREVEAAYRREARRREFEVQQEVGRGQVIDQTVRFAEGKINYLNQLLQGNTGKPGEEDVLYKQILAVTGQLDRKELTPQLLSARINALDQQAKRDAQKEADALAAIKTAEKQRDRIIEAIKGLKGDVKSGNKDAVLKIVTDDPEVSVEKNNLLPAPSAEPQIQFSDGFQPGRRRPGDIL